MKNAIMFLLVFLALIIPRQQYAQIFVKTIATGEDEIPHYAIQTSDGGYLVNYVAGVYSDSDPGRLGYRDILVKIDSQGNILDSLVYYDTDTTNFVITGLTKRDNDFLVQGSYIKKGVYTQVSYRIIRYNYNLQLIHDTTLSIPGCELATGQIMINHAGNLVLPGTFRGIGQTESTSFCREMTIDGHLLREKIYEVNLPVNSYRLIELTGNHTYNLLGLWTIVQLDTNFNYIQTLYTAPSVMMPGYLYYPTSPKNVDNYNYLVGGWMIQSNPVPSAEDVAWGLFNNGSWDMQYQFGTIDTSDFFMGMDFISPERIYTSVTQLNASSSAQACPLGEFNPINNQMLLFNTNINGTVNWFKRYSGLGYMRSGPPVATADSGCLWLGYYWDWHHKTNHNYDIVMIKLLKNGTFTGMSEQVQDKGLIKVFPNPGSLMQIECFYPEAECTLFNTLSQHETTVKLQKGINIINTSGFKPGIYFYHITFHQKKVSSGKWIKN